MVKAFRFNYSKLREFAPNVKMLGKVIIDVGKHMMNRDTVLEYYLISQGLF